MTPYLGLMISSALGVYRSGARCRGRAESKLGSEVARQTGPTEDLRSRIECSECGV